MGNDKPVERISCPSLSQSDFRDDGKGVIAHSQTDLYVQLEKNILRRNDINTCRSGQPLSLSLSFTVVHEGAHIWAAISSLTARARESTETQASAAPLAPHHKACGEIGLRQKLLERREQMLPQRS
jgi:hypothetical protein